MSTTLPSHTLVINEKISYVTETQHTVITTVHTLSTRNIYHSMQRQGISK